MNKKIIALACSPSKGFNSDSMLDAFLSGVAEVKDVEVEKIYLSDLNIANYSFFNRIADPVKEPEAAALIEKLVSAKALVIATPTFNFGVPAALKNLLDRMSSKALDPKKINWLHQPTGMLKDLRTFYLVSCGTPRLLKFLAFPLFPDFWLRVIFWYFGAKTWGAVSGTSLNTNHLAKNDLKLMAKCKKAGMNYARKLSKV